VPAQLSFLAANLQPASIHDLDGVLLGGGQLVRIGGTARLSVVVSDRWRVAALLAAYGERGLIGEPAALADGVWSVRTPFSRALAPVAQRWARGATKVLPPRFALDGARLRLWMVTSGRRDAQGCTLAMGSSDGAIWESAGAALAAAGIAATLQTSRVSTPAYRLVGRRRIMRLTEYVGEPPAGSAGDWPQWDQ
jgi:hypothetical protein